MNHKTRRFKTKLTLRVLKKTLLTTLTAFVLTAIIFFVFLYFAQQRIWYGDEWLFVVYNAFSRNIPLMIVLALGVEFILISLYFLREVVSYLQETVNALDEVYAFDETLIHLSPELSEVEENLNNIKQSLEKSTRIAKESERRKNDLIVYLAHDLKTPLTSVIGYVSLLNDEKEISNALKDKYLSIALRKAERLEDLINEFFEITRFNLSNLELEKSKVNLRLMLEQIIFEFEPMLKEKNLKVALDYTGESFAYLDANKIQRVFDNLMRNAINYSYEDSDVNIVVDHTEHLLIKFVNQGVTIPQEKLNRLFEQFFRLDSARVSSSGNAGLGLSIAKEIVKLHQGDIHAHSNDETITFTIQIPQAQAY